MAHFAAMWREYALFCTSFRVISSFKKSACRFGEGSLSASYCVEIRMILVLTLSPPSGAQFVDVFFLSPSWLPLVGQVVVLKGQVWFSPSFWDSFVHCRTWLPCLVNSWRLKRQSVVHVIHVWQSMVEPYTCFALVSMCR